MSPRNGLPWTSVDLFVHVLRSTPCCDSILVPFGMSFSARCRMSSMLIPLPLATNRAVGLCNMASSFLFGLFPYDECADVTACRLSGVARNGDFLCGHSRQWMVYCPFIEASKRKCVTLCRGSPCTPYSMHVHYGANPSLHGRRLITALQHLMASLPKGSCPRINCSIAMRGAGPNGRGRDILMTSTPFPQGQLSPLGASVLLKADGLR